MAAASAAAQDLVAAQGLGPTMSAYMCVADAEAGKQGNVEEESAAPPAEKRRRRAGCLRPAGVWSAVFAGKHSMAQCAVGCRLVICCLLRLRLTAGRGWTHGGW